MALPDSDLSHRLLLTTCRPCQAICCKQTASQQIASKETLATGKASEALEPCDFGLLLAGVPLEVKLPGKPWAVQKAEQRQSQWIREPDSDQTTSLNY